MAAAAKQNFRRMGENYDFIFLAVSRPKFTKFWDDVGDSP